MGKYLFLNGNPGQSEPSANNLEIILKDLSLEQKRGKPIKIYELRNEENNNLIRVGFYLKSPDVAGFVGPSSFWIPTNYHKIVDKYVVGGAGPAAYKRSIALIYRYLAHQPRVVVGFRDTSLSTIENSTYQLDKTITSLPIKEVIEEDESISTRILNDLGFLAGFSSEKTDLSVIFMDTETTSLKVGTPPEYQLGSTWDFYHGLRNWGEDQGEELARECNRFDKVVTYNGDNFDFPRVLMRFSKKDIEEVMARKSVDLYKIIAQSVDEQKTFRRKGETTLANIAFATLSLTKWNVLYESDLKDREKPLEFELSDHCARDVEMTKELFFYMLQYFHVYNITKNAMETGRVIERIDIHSRLKEALSKKN